MNEVQSLPEMIRVQSSQIVAVGYAQDSYDMFVEFLGGRVYRYANVEKSVFDEMVRAKSVGTYFHKNIRYAKGDNGELRYPYETVRGGAHDMPRDTRHDLIDDSDVPF